MIVRPVSSNVQNGIILGIACVFSGYAIMGNGWKASPQVSIGWLVASIGGAIWCLLGGINSTPGWMQEGVFFVLFPAAFMAIIAASGWRTFGNLLSAIPVGMTVVSALSLVYLASVRGLLPGFALTIIDLGFGVGGEGTSTAGQTEFGYGIRSFNLSSLAFGAPFLIAVIVLGMRFESRISDLARWPALVLTISTLLVSGRRGLIVSTAIASLALLVIMYFRQAGDGRRRISARYVLAVAVGAALATRATGFSPSAFISVLLNTGADPRISAQGPAFMQSIASNPFVGNGFGAILENYIANAEQPWRYEMQYHLLVNSMGFVGTLFILMPTLYVLASAVRVATRNGNDSTPYGDATLAVLVGTLSVLIGNASNPYLHTVGHYWMFFITVLAVDLHLRVEKRRRTIPARTPDS